MSTYEKTIALMQNLPDHQMQTVYLFVKSLKTQTEREPSGDFGCLEGKASVSFSDDWEMTDEELLRS